MKYHTLTIFLLNLASIVCKYVNQVYYSNFSTKTYYCSVKFQRKIKEEIAYLSKCEKPLLREGVREIISYLDKNSFLILQKSINEFRNHIKDAEKASILKFNYLLNLKFLEPKKAEEIDATAKRDFLYQTKKIKGYVDFAFGNIFEKLNIVESKILCVRSEINDIPLSLIVKNILLKNSSIKKSIRALSNHYLNSLKEICSTWNLLIVHVNQVVLNIISGETTRLILYSQRFIFRGFIMMLEQVQKMILSFGFEFKKSFSSSVKEICEMLNIINTKTDDKALKIAFKVIHFKNKKLGNLRIFHD